MEYFGSRNHLHPHSLSVWQANTVRVLERTYGPGVYMNIPFQEWDHPNLYATSWFAELAVALHRNESKSFQTHTRQYLIHSLNQINLNSTNHGLPGLYQIKLIVNGLQSLPHSFNDKIRTLIDYKMSKFYNRKTGLYRWSGSTTTGNVYATYTAMRISRQTKIPIIKSPLPVLKQKLQNDLPPQQKTIPMLVPILDIIWQEYPSNPFTQSTRITLQHMSVKVARFLSSSGLTASTFSTYFSFQNLLSQLHKRFNYHPKVDLKFALNGMIILPTSIPAPDPQITYEVFRATHSIFSISEENALTKTVHLFELPQGGWVLPVIGNTTFYTTYAATTMLQQWGLPSHVTAIGQFTDHVLKNNQINSLENMYFAIRLLQMAHHSIPTIYIMRFVRKKNSSALSNMYWATRIAHLLKWPVNTSEVDHVLQKKIKNIPPLYSPSYYQMSYERTWLAYRYASLTTRTSVIKSIASQKLDTKESLPALYFWSQTQHILGNYAKVNLIPFQLPGGGYSFLPHNPAGDILSTYFGWKLAER